MTDAPRKKPSKEDALRARFQAELVFTGHRDVTVAEQEEYNRRLAAANEKMKNLGKEESVLVLGTLFGERIWADSDGWHGATSEIEEKVKDLPAGITEAVCQLRRDYHEDIDFDLVKFE